MLTDVGGHRPGEDTADVGVVAAGGGEEDDFGGVGGGEDGGDDGDVWEVANYLGGT